MSYGDDYEVRLSLNNWGFRTPGMGRSRKGVHFSPTEIKELGIAIVILTFAFAFAFSSNGIFSLTDPLALFYRMTFALPVAFLAVATGFALHEIAHKIVANYYGYPAAFSYSMRGLMFALGLSFLLGVLIAAPGAVFIYGYPTKKENGIISLAGPLTNAVIGSVSLGLSFGAGMMDMGIISYVFYLIGLINAFLGAFNMIPFMPLDGAKIWRWNKIVYIVLATLLISLIIYGLF